MKVVKKDSYFMLIPGRSESVKKQKKSKKFEKIDFLIFYYGITYFSTREN